MTKSPAREKQVIFYCPPDLHLALKVRAAQQSTSVRVVILDALRTAGFDVSETDLSDRRR